MTRWLTIFPLVLLGCTSLDTQLPPTDNLSLQNEKIAQEAAAFKEMNHLRARLDKVAHRVLTANVDLCEKRAPDAGIRTQNLKSFPKELRPAARRELGVGSEHLIVYVRPNSPAEKAGLQYGDQIYGKNGVMAAPSKTLNWHLREGVQIQKSRQGKKETINLEAEDACYYPAMLRMSSAINAYANGKTIVVTAGMMNFIESDDELAYIIGHELAHNTHSHIRKSITNYVLSLGGTRYTRIFETEADYVGLYYMARAGYDPANVEDFWRRLALRSLRGITRAKTHPSYPNRSVQIEATRVEIAAKQAAGEPLIPEPKAE